MVELKVGFIQLSVELGKTEKGSVLPERQQRDSSVRIRTGWWWQKRTVETAQRDRPSLLGLDVVEGEQLAEESVG